MPRLGIKPQPSLVCKGSGDGGLFGLFPGKHKTRGPGGPGKSPRSRTHKPTCLSKSQGPGTGTGCGGREAPLKILSGNREAKAEQRSRGPCFWKEATSVQWMERAPLDPHTTHSPPVADSDGGPDAATGLATGQPTPGGREASPGMGQQQATVSPVEGTSSLVQLGNGFLGGWGHGMWHTGCHSPQHPDRKCPGIIGWRVLMKLWPPSEP